jgi:cytochrome P450
LIVGFKRYARVPITLSDGVVLPKHTHLMMPIYPIVVDPSVTPSPMTFDGFRHYKLRQIPGEEHKHQFATTSNTNLHFGHGKFSCPGRFFAANSIKMIISNLLLKYDFRFPGEGERPNNVHLHEYVFPDPEGVVQFRLKKRKANEEDE